MTLLRMANALNSFHIRNRFSWSGKGIIKGVGLQPK
jgi:hypothetical protein